MKVIITEEQLRLIIENEGEGNLMDFTKIYKGGMPYNKWDSYFLFMNKKKGGKYDGYYIDDDLDLRKHKMGDISDYYTDDYEYDYTIDDKEDKEDKEDKPFGLEYLVRVNGFLHLKNNEVADLSNLKYVERYLNISGTDIDRLPELEYVGGGFAMENTKISELPNLKYVGGILSISGSPLVKDYDKLRETNPQIWKKIKR